MSANDRRILAQKRRRLTELDLAPRGITHRVLEAFASVPREAFVPEALAEHAYENRPLPIGGAAGRAVL